jgi:DNA modification methylase
VEVLSELISLFTLQGELVFDPAMGSGSTMAACVKTGRSFLGIEKDFKAYKVTLRRCAHEQRLGD